MPSPDGIVRVKIFNMRMYISYIHFDILLIVCVYIYIYMYVYIFICIYNYINTVVENYDLQGGAWISVTLIGWTNAPRQSFFFFLTTMLPYIICVHVYMYVCVLCNFRLVCDMRKCILRCVLVCAVYNVRIITYIFTATIGKTVASIRTVKQKKRKKKKKKRKTKKKVYKTRSLNCSSTLNAVDQCVYDARWSSK